MGDNVNEHGYYLTVEEITVEGVEPGNWLGHEVDEDWWLLFFYVSGYHLTEEEITVEGVEPCNWLDLEVDKDCCSFVMWNVVLGNKK